MDYRLSFQKQVLKTVTELGHQGRDFIYVEQEDVELKVIFIIVAPRISLPLSKSV